MRSGCTFLPPNDIRGDEMRKDEICRKFRKHGEFAHVGSENQKVRKNLDDLGVDT
jgi:hypothetical protein